MDAITGFAGSAPVLPFDFGSAAAAVGADDTVGGVDSAAGVAAFEDTFAGSIEELIGLLKDQHDDINALFWTYESLGAQAMVTRRILAGELLEALERHVKVEVRHFLPLYRMVDEHKALLAAEHLALLRGVVRSTSRAARAGKPVETKMALLRDMFQSHRSEQEDHEFCAVRNVVAGASGATGTQEPTNLVRFRRRKNSIQLC